tara:strand:- start:155 stop:730 length:576 start_codon:yes stop_codon:yes gene_type:complete
MGYVGSIVTQNVVDTADIADASITTAKLASGAITNAVMPTGTILQVLQATDTTDLTYSTTNTWADLGNLSLAITPRATSSKILVSCQIGCVDHATNSYLVAFKYVRGSTTIGGAYDSGIGGTTGIRGEGSGDTNAVYGAVLPQFLDSPSTTSATTYKVQYNNYNGGNFYYLRDAGTNESYIATLTLMEIQG